MELPKPKYTVYCLKNAKTGLKYIGQTIRCADKRFQEHIYMALSGSNTPLHKSIREDGPDSFDLEVLGTVSSRKDLDDLERELIQKHATMVPNGYNVLAGGQDFGRLQEEGYRRDPVKLIGDLTKSDLKHLISLCRSNGLTNLRVGEIEIVLDPHFERPRRAKRSQQAEKSDHIPTEGAFSDEDALFWSSAGIPEQSGAQ